MKEITLKITGTQITPDGEKDTIELVTQGKYYKKNSCIFLVYDESEISGMEDCTTTLKIGDDQIMMKRFGAAESKLIFEKGIRHKTMYGTAYGNMEMEVTTSKIHIEEDEKGLKKLDLCYRLNVCGNAEMKNELCIEIL